MIATRIVRHPGRPGRCAWVVAIALAAPAATLFGQTATRPAAPGADAQAAALLAKVRADPLDAAARERLGELRDRQRREMLSACQALEQGLKAYLRDGPELAAPILRKAARDPRVVALTRPLARPLDKALADVRAGSAHPGRAKRVCVRCGGTGRIDCVARRCNGSGKVPCSQCKGKGLLTVAQAFPRPAGVRRCADCEGSGVVDCKICGQSGAVPCPECGKRPRPAAGGAALTPLEEKAVRQIMWQARYLARGGIDLYTDGALKPTPK